MMGLYFSGTGNTKYVLELFLKKLSESSYTICSIEESNTLEYIKQAKAFLQINNKNGKATNYQEGCTNDRSEGVV